ncbi:MAG: hypothetical protein J6A63_04675 [Clostridia bacterium]|nr:hypothetical protein [Clostridia bacterium]
MKRICSFLIAACLLFIGIFSFAACEEKGEEFSILTWNVYLGKGESQSVMNVLNEKSPDIIQMQEANTLAYTKFIQPFLEEHPEYFILNTMIGGETLRTPILFNTDKFDYIDSGEEMLTDAHALTVMKTLGWILLESKLGNKLLCVNFHGAKCLNKYEGYENYTAEQLAETEEIWHQGNVRQVFSRIQEVLELHGECKVIITGDCNFNSTSGAYSMLSETGYLDAETSAKTNQQDGMKSHHKLGVELSDAGLTIDHVFYNGVMNTHEILRTSDVYLGSDHCPVFVTAEI